MTNLILSAIDLPPILPPIRPPLFAEPGEPEFACEVPTHYHPNILGSYLCDEWCNTHKFSGDPARVNCPACSTALRAILVL